MEKDTLYYKDIAKQVFHEFPAREIGAAKSLLVPPQPLLMALNTFTCIIRSNSAEENEKLIEKQEWRYLIKDPWLFFEEYDKFFDDLDISLPNTVQHSQKMEDLKSRIKKFNVEVRDFWDLEYHKNQALIGYRMTIAIDAIIKLWDLKYSMSLL